MCRWCFLFKCHLRLKHNQVICTSCKLGEIIFHSVYIPLLPCLKSLQEYINKSFLSVVFLPLCAFRSTNLSPFLSLSLFIFFNSPYLLSPPLATVQSSPLTLLRQAYKGTKNKSANQVMKLTPPITYLFSLPFTLPLFVHLESLIGV